MGKDSWLAEVAALPDMPDTGTRKVRTSWNGSSDLWLYPPPYPSLEQVADNEAWDGQRRRELDIPLAMNFMIADFGTGSEEALVLDCSETTGGCVRHLRYQQQENLAFECPVAFLSISEFQRQILEQPRGT